MMVAEAADAQQKRTADELMQQLEEGLALEHVEDGDSEDDDEGELTLAADPDDGGGGNDKHDGGCCGPDAVLRVMQAARDNFVQAHCCDDDDEQDGQESSPELLAAFNTRLQAALHEVLARQPAARALLLPQATAAGGSLLQSLAELLARHQPGVADQLDEEAHELLAAASDAAALHQLLRDARGGGGPEGGGPLGGPELSVQGSKVLLHAEEQEDGEARPDLDGALCVSVPRVSAS